MSEMSAPGSAEARAISRMRRSWLRRGSRGGGMRNGKREKGKGRRDKRKDPRSPFCFLPSPLTGVRLQTVALQPPIQRTSAEAKRLRGLADVAVVAGHRLLDEEALDVF